MKDVSLEALVQFINSLSLEDVYVQVPGMFGEDKVEINFKDGAWLINHRGEAYIRNIPASQLVKVLVNMRLSLSDVRSQLLESLISQVGYASMFLREAEELLSKESVRDILEDHKQFTENLLDTVDDFFKPKLTVVKED